MPEQTGELRRINWAEAFPFTNIFRTFKLAIHPGKLLIALLAILLIGLWGWVLDSVWGKRNGPLPNEIKASWQVQNLASWRQSTLEQNAARLRFACDQVDVRVSPDEVDSYQTNPAKVVKQKLDDIAAAGNDALEKLETNLRSGSKPVIEQREDIAALARKYRSAYEQVRELAPKGISRGLLSYEIRMLEQFVGAACDLNFAGGFGDVLAARSLDARDFDSSLDMMRVSAGDRVPGRHLPAGGPGFEHGLGMLSCVAMMLHGLCWLFKYHFFYALLFGIPALGIASLAGGAICRMAALNFARREQISVKTALDFSRRKLPGLFTAPLFPVMLLIGIGALMVIGGLVSAIPAVGEILFVLFLLLAIVGGLLIAGVSLGAVAGGSLMWPTIAVEASDSFDAMSRTYSYVYTRPWKAVFYGLVLAVYGAICFLFARFFLLIALKGIRFFFAIGLLGTDRPGLGDPAATKIDSLWPMPTFEHLRHLGVPIGMPGAEPFAACLVFLWVTLIVALLYAFAASFWMCGSTIIYYLLRREVDATDYEDVYLEEDEEQDDGPMDLGDPSAPLPATPAPSPSPAPSELEGGRAPGAPPAGNPESN